MPAKRMSRERWRRNHFKNTTHKQRYTEVHWPKIAHCDTKRDSDKAQARNVKHKKLNNDDGVGQQVQESKCEKETDNVHKNVRQSRENIFEKSWWKS